MKYIYTIDSDGFYVPEALKREPDDYINKKNEIDIPIADGFYSPRWDGAKWIEGGEPPEPQEWEPTPLQLMEQSITDLEIEIAELKSELEG